MRGAGLHWFENLKRFSGLMLFLWVVSISPTSAMAESSDCYVERLIYRSGGEEHFHQSATSNVGYPAGQSLPTQNISIEMVFNVHMNFETFHPYSVYIRHAPTGATNGGQFIKGDIRDEQDNPRSIIFVIHETLKNGTKYALFVQGWDLVPSANATVANAQQKMPENIMPHSLQWVFTTQEVPVSAPESTEPQKEKESETFYTP